ncbi:MAG TPA: VCBS repeat-containing protein [Fimbriimonadaceae bacterium]|nr:VCBS repeat-containing protein [Fimbriimonadaceae bacterium]
MLSLAATLLGGELHEPFLAQANGKPISAPIGHLAPILYDFDNDGLKDLALGTFSPGVIRIYRNVGSKTEPKFGEFQTVQAGGKEIQVESG